MKNLLEFSGWIYIKFSKKTFKLQFIKVEDQ